MSLPSMHIRRDGRRRWLRCHNRYVGAGAINADVNGQTVILTPDQCVQDLELEWISASSVPAKKLASALNIKGACCRPPFFWHEKRKRT